MPWRRFLVLSLLLTGLVARADIEFTGVLTSSEQTLFNLTDTSTATTSGWVSLGQSFAGHALKSYDAQNELLTLAKDGAETVVRLNDSKVQAVRVKIRGELKVRFGESASNLRTTLVFDTDNTFPLKNGVFHITPRPLADGNIRYELSFVRPGPGGKPESFSAPAAVAGPGQEFGLRIWTGEKPADVIELSFRPRGN